MMISMPTNLGQMRSAKQFSQTEDPILMEDYEWFSQTEDPILMEDYEWEMMIA